MQIKCLESDTVQSLTTQKHVLIWKCRIIIIPQLLLWFTMFKRHWIFRKANKQTSYCFFYITAHKLLPPALYTTARHLPCFTWSIVCFLHFCTLWMFMFLKVCDLYCAFEMLYFDSCYHLRTQISAFPETGKVSYKVTFHAPRRSQIPDWMLCKLIFGLCYDENLHLL